jgi:hypothetical protein
LADLLGGIRLCPSVYELVGDILSPSSPRGKFGFPETETLVRRDPVRTQAYYYWEGEVSLDDG